MYGNVTVSGKDVRLKATAATLRRYRAWFGRDLLKDFKKVQTAFEKEEEVTEEIFELVNCLFYTMARQADSTVPEDVDDWLDQFDTFPITDIAIAVVTLWAKSLEVDVELKNA